MATSLTHDAHEDWAEPLAMPGDPTTRAEWLLWTLFSLALLGAFLFFVLDDYQLRNLIAAQ